MPPPLILCIDNRPELLQIRKATLERLGASVVTATTSIAALGAVEPMPIAAVNRPHSAVVSIPAEIDTWISDTRHIGAAQPPSSHTASNIIASRAKLKSNTAILIDRTHKLENALARTIALITPLGSREYHLLPISRR